MKATIQYNTMNGLWTLLIDCSYDEAPKYIRLMAKIIVKILHGSILPGNRRRIRSGKHFVIQGQVIELHSDEWFPLILACRHKEVIEGVKDIFMDMLSKK